MTIFKFKHEHGLNMYSKIKHSFNINAEFFFQTKVIALLAGVYFFHIFAGCISCIAYRNHYRLQKSVLEVTTEMHARNEFVRCSEC